MRITPISVRVIYWEGDDPRASLQEWLKERGREVYNFEPAETLEADEEVFEAKVG